jgi:hypothetical protein
MINLAGNLIKALLPSLPMGAQERAINPSEIVLSTGVRNIIDSINVSNWQGPNQPLAPIAPPQTLPRVFDYPFGANLFFQPRAEQPGSPDFNQLRMLAQYDIVRLCIETRKVQIIEMPGQWRVKRQPGEKRKDYDGRNGEDERVEFLANFFQMPDHEHSEKQWMNMMVEEILVTDALSIWPVMNQDSELIALRLIDGGTIKPLHDPQGWRPDPPNPAFQQIVKGCYSSDTEVLTRRGWLLFKDVVKEDQCATRGKGGQMEWQHPTELIDYEYAGPMHLFSSERVDLLVTPDHRMLVTRVPHKLRNRVERTATGLYLRAADLATNYTTCTRVPQTAIWKGIEVPGQRFPRERFDKHFQRLEMDTQICAARAGEGLSYSQLAGRFGVSLSAAHNAVRLYAVRGRKRQPQDCFPIEMSGDDFCAFMGAYLSEGSCNLSMGSVVCVSQLANGKAFKPYAKLLERVSGGRARYVGNSFLIYSTSLVHYLRQFGHSRDKWVPDSIMNATPRQLAIFWHYYWLGDGSDTGERKISTSSRQMAGQLQEIAMKLGKSASISIVPACRRTINMNDGKGDRVVNCSDHFKICLRNHTPETLFSKIETVAYNGRVCCVSVPNGNLYVRRNGKPAWCGNSPAINMTAALCDDCAKKGWHADVSKPDGKGMCLPLVYRPFNPTVNKFYGYSPTEQIIHTIMIGMNRMVSQASLYTEGNLPEAIVGLPNEWGLEQVKSFQAFFDELAGNVSIKRRVRFVPGDAKFVQTKDPMIKDDRDDWLARICCYAFSVAPNALTKMMNRASAQQIQQSAIEEGKLPMLGQLAELKTYLAHQYFGPDFADIEYAYNTDQQSDPAVQSKINDTNIRNGSRSINEVRDDDGLDPVPGGEKCYVFLPTGPVSLEDIAAGKMPAAAPGEMPGQAASEAGQEPGQPPAKSKGKVSPQFQAKNGGGKVNGKQLSAAADKETRKLLKLLPAHSMLPSANGNGNEHKFVY